MITDSLDRAEMYRPLHPGVAAALIYLQRTNFDELSEGRHELDGQRLVAIAQRYVSRTPEAAVWESHRKYIDVQYVATGAERFGYMPATAEPPIRQPYDADRDVTFYNIAAEHLASVSLTALPAKHFAVFYPHDIHSPGLMLTTEPSPVFKVVVKVAVDWNAKS